MVYYLYHYIEHSQCSIVHLHYPIVHNQWSIEYMQKFNEHVQNHHFIVQKFRLHIKSRLVFHENKGLKAQDSIHFRHKAEKRRLGVTYYRWCLFKFERYHHVCPLFADDLQLVPLNQTNKCPLRSYLDSGDQGIFCEDVF